MLRAAAGALPAVALLSLLLCAPSATAACPGAERLSEALRLLHQANPVLLAERARDSEQARQHAWEAAITVGYSITETFESGAAGPNAQLRVRIPLWDRSTQLQTAKDHAATIKRQADAEAALIADLQTLCEQAHDTRALERRRDFTKDRLNYRQERVDQGLDPADSLWSEAEAMQTASHDWQRAQANLVSSRLALARQYAGDQWGRMLTLLEAMTR